MTRWWLWVGLALWGCAAEESGNEIGADPAGTEPPVESRPLPISALPSSAEEVDLVPRATWGAADPIVDRMREHGRAIEHVTIHHTASLNGDGKDELAVMRAVQRFHQGSERSWGDLAYHFLIGPSGTVYEGRDPKYAADTSTRYDPAGHLTLCLMGNFEEEEPTDAALSALVRLTVDLLAAHDLPPDAVTTHRRVAATACPGANLEAWLAGDGQARIRDAHTHRVRSTTLQRGEIAR